MRKFALLALAAALAGPAAAEAPQPADYVVRMTMREGGRIVASPSLTVSSGSAATFMKGDRAYWVKLMATPGADGQVALVFDSVLSRPEGLRHYGSAITVAADGAPASFSAGGDDPGGAAKAMRLDVSVRPLD
jgi:hypothetical protein